MSKSMFTLKYSWRRLLNKLNIGMCIANLGTTASRHNTQFQKNWSKPLSQLLHAINWSKPPPPKPQETSAPRSSGWQAPIHELTNNESALVCYNSN